LLLPQELLELNVMVFVIQEEISTMKMVSKSVLLFKDSTCVPLINFLSSTQVTEV
jgi:hypothetical protein